MPPNNWTRYGDNPEFRLKQNYWHKVQRRRHRLELLQFLADSVCAHCNEQADIFHHIDPETKRFSIFQGTARSFESILIELDKCIPLCYSCHQHHHRPGAKFSEDQVRTMRICYPRMTYQQIADEFGCSISVAYDIVKSNTYKGVLPK